jgi:hypothetical protein
MSKYRTAMGKMLDMSILTSKNELTRAVGNLKVNARGDTIDAQGRIVKPVNSKVNDNYAKTVGNRSAQAKNRPQALTPTPIPVPVIPQIDIAELSPIELELEENLQEELEIEKIKQQEVKQQETKQEVKQSKKKTSDE